MSLIIDDKLHANLPTLTATEYAGLEHKILTEGFRDPIVTWAGTNIILDGRSRYNICQKHNIAFTTSSIVIPDNDSARIWIIDNQSSKRNISEFTKFELLEEKQELLKKDGNDKKLKTLKRGNMPVLSTVDKTEKPINTQKEIAKEIGKSTGHVAKLDYVKKYADEPTKEKLRKNEMSVDKVYKTIKQQTYKQSETLRKNVSEITINIEDIKLFNVDILQSPIEDNSLDVIITDPPYPREYLDCWQKLAEFAVKKLKPDGILLAMSGQSYLPDVYRNMSIEGLNYYWTGCIYTPGVSPVLQVKRLKTNWKPFLMYVKGEYKGTFQPSDVYTSQYEDTNNGQDYHKWGQSYPIFNSLVRDYTYKDSIVCDPFLGGGTTAIACINNKRKFIGIEIDKDTFNIASNRINNELL